MIFQVQWFWKKFRGASRSSESPYKLRGVKRITVRSKSIHPVFREIILWQQALWNRWNKYMNMNMTMNINARHSVDTVQYVLPDAPPLMPPGPGDSLSYLLSTADPGLSSKMNPPCAPPTALGDSHAGTLTEGVDGLWICIPHIQSIKHVSES